MSEDHDFRVSRCMEREVELLTWSKSALMERILPHLIIQYLALHREVAKARFVPVGELEVSQDFAVLQIRDSPKITVFGVSGLPRDHSSF
jgi:hypothetical protein